MDNKKAIEDEIREYRAQFEKSMASIVAYEARAKVEMAELRACQEAVVVKDKTTLKPEDVDKFVGAMRDVARYLLEYASNMVYGAVAYIRFESEADKYAERQGLYVIRATGDSASIVNDDDFNPESFAKSSSRRAGHLRAVPMS